MQIDLGKKIFYPTFCVILTILGYLDNKDGSAENRKFRSSNDPLVRLAWRTIRTKCPADELEENYNIEAAGPYEVDSQVEMIECVTFENFAMLLNLINNVYIKNKI